jgi:fumarate reductase subunit C
MERINGKRYAAVIFFTILLMVCNDVFAGATEAKLQSFYSWLKPIVNIILAIITLGAAGRAIFKTFFKHQEAGMEWIMFALGCIMWGLWITFASEIISNLGGGSVIF